MKQSKTKQNQCDPKQEKKKKKKIIKRTQHTAHYIVDVAVNIGRILNKVLHKSQPSPRDNKNVCFLSLCLHPCSFVEQQRNEFEIKEIYFVAAAEMRE